jgi:hypothetical protein
MKHLYSLLILIAVGVGSVFGQHGLHSDSSDIRFLPLDREPDSAGLDLKIVTKNISKRPIRVYQRLQDGELGDVFCNVAVEMEKKDSAGEYKAFQPVLYHPDLNWRVRPENRHRDIEKKALAPNAIDTLSISLLKFTGSIFPGEYRFKAYFKVKTIPDNRPYDPELDSAKEPPMDKPEYVRSEYMYFKVVNYIRLALLGPDGKPKN